MVCLSCLIYHLEMIDFILILILCAIAWYWWDTSYCNELAFKTCQQHCTANSVQLLDNSVSRQRVWFRRGDTGNLQICRLYNFEYSDDRESRHFGFVVLLGHFVAEIRLESPPLNQS